MLQYYCGPLSRPGDGFSLLQIVGPGNQVYAVSIVFDYGKNRGRRTLRNPAISGDKRDDMLSRIVNVGEGTPSFDEFDELLALGKFISQPSIFGDKLLAFQRGPSRINSSISKWRVLNLRMVRVTPARLHGGITAATRLPACALPALF